MIQASFHILRILMVFGQTRDRLLCQKGPQGSQSLSGLGADEESGHAHAIYRVVIVQLQRQTDGKRRVTSVAEITGSESFIHLDVGQARYVALVPGIRRLEPM